MSRASNDAVPAPDVIGCESCGLASLNLVEGERPDLVQRCPRCGHVLHLVNHDAPGVLHDFAIDPLEVATELVLPDQSREVTFRVPDRPGTYEYYCRPHAAVMRGQVDVRRR